MTLQERLGILSNRLQDENEERKKSHVTFEDEERGSGETGRSRPIVAPLSFSSPRSPGTRGARNEGGR